MSNQGFPLVNRTILRAYPPAKREVVPPSETVGFFHDDESTVNSNCDPACRDVASSRNPIVSGTPDSKQ
jgi:hypothetical protein